MNPGRKSFVELRQSEKKGNLLLEMMFGYFCVSIQSKRKEKWNDFVPLIVYVVYDRI